MTTKPFIDTEYYKYVKALENGAKLNSFYDYSGQCINNVVLTLSDVYWFQNGQKVNATQSWTDTQKIFNNAWNISTIIAGTGNNAIYYCYLF